MEWANGDVRVNLVRESSFSRIPERGSSVGGGGGDKSTGVVRGGGDFTTQVHMPPSIPQPPRDEYPANPNYYQRSATAPYGGLIHPDYNKRKYRNAPLTSYHLERQDEIDKTCSVDYPSLPRGFSTVSHGYVAGPPSDDSCSQTCAECPGGGAPCDYGPGDTVGSYSLVDMVAPSGMAPEPPDNYTIEIGNSNVNSNAPPPVVMPAMIQAMGPARHAEPRQSVQYQGLRGVPRF